MNTFTRRLIGTLSAIVLVGISLVGCQSEPTSTQDLLSRYTGSSNLDNYHLDLDIDLGFSILGQQMNVASTGSYDVCGQGIHGTNDVDLSALQQPNLTMEQYGEHEGDSFVQYTGTNVDDKTTWVKTKVSGKSLTEELSSEEILSSAEFKKTAESDESYYELSIPGGKLFQMVISNMGDSLDFLGGTDTSLVERIFENSSTIYTFDKDCMLRAISISASYDPSEGEDDALPFNIQASLMAKIGNYGGVDASAVAIPDDVKKSAVEAPDVEDLTSLIGGDDGAQSTGASQNDSSSSAANSTSTTGKAA